MRGESEFDDGKCSSRYVRPRRRAGDENYVAIMRGEVGRQVNLLSATDTVCSARTCFPTCALAKAMHSALTSA